MALQVMAMTMAEKSSNNKLNANGAAPQLNPTFHDFLGMSCAPLDAPVAAAKAAAAATVASSKVAGSGGGDIILLDASPSASASVGASSGGGAAPISATSDLASERPAGNHLEGVPFYGLRSDLSGPEVSNRFVGSKRSSSDSAFMVSSRDGFPQKGPESAESSHLMKMLKNGSVGERSWRSADEEHFFGVQSRRQASASLALQQPPGCKPDASVSKFDRSAALNIGAPAQYHMRMGQYVPLVNQPPNRYRDMNGGPSIISQTAADEGSRTGIKGSGILGSVNGCGGMSERSSSAMPAGGSRPKPGTHISDPELSTPGRQQGLTSVSQQMTIFYGGQAHVFDDVHPNKADVIMALAGSNGGSWSTTYSPRSTTKPVSESYIPNGEKDLFTVSNMVYPADFRDRLPVTGKSCPAIGPGDRIMKSVGAPRGCLITKGTRNPAQAGEPSAEEKR